MNALTFSLGQRRVPGSAKGRFTAVVFGDVAGCSLNDLQRRLVTSLVVVVPGTHAVMAKQDALGLRVLFDQILNDQPDIEAWPLPWHVDQLVAVNLPAEPLLINRCGDRDDGVRMQMVYMFVRNERMQWGVDRAGPRVQIENAVAVEWIHCVFDLTLRPALRTVQVERLHRSHFIQVERSES